MAVKTRWVVTHACGDEVEHDLSARPADRRAGYARWLSGRDCTDCWRAQRDGNRAEERAAWIAGRRAEEQQAAAAWAEQYRMPPLSGPEKILDWGERCRHQLVAAAYKALVVEGPLTEGRWEEVEAQARTVDRAGWWLDQREAAPVDLPELLEAATDADRSTENPY
ncbi:MULTISPECIES: hypothetical protein [unclassified Kitasatospora]|uniref:hypothetical protein n=1 Tax=unclassified Kitasatospora TaxID=2633591 RepID=UPI00070EAC67|nr:MULTISPECIES: hypothetical protein [unclassified Kitasatospora]KQV20944.1 hypothetical protein ASC99_20800 [Kitasatospora sp. Root107]KRB60402.1 hypothetical protein ASE03_12380 [Kitasatospora sp. Root187]